MNQRSKTLLNWLLILLIVVGGILIGRWTVTIVKAEVEGYQDLKVFTEVIAIVKRNYVEDVDVKDLIYGAIKGMISSLDPHSSFLTPDFYKEMQVDTKGEFGGLGIQIGIKNGILTVIAPIEDTPAFKAGIEAGDKILKVEGELTKKMSLLDAVHKMRGPKGTKVTITVIREGWDDMKDFTIVRDIIKVKSVKFRVIDESIGYIKIIQFQEKTSEDLLNAIESLKEEKITALVLDLRNNPGGLLQSAVGVSEQFLPPKKLVVYIKGRNGEKAEFLSEGEDKLNGLPMVVLVNQGSASASEIVAGALKDWNRAVLLGVTTFGKGSVQSILPLSDGSGLRLTTAKYYTPMGISIQNTGITPDILVELKPQKGTMHRVFREKDLEGHLENEQVDEEQPVQDEMVPAELDEKEDIQLQRAIDLLKAWKVLKKFPDAA